MTALLDHAPVVDVHCHGWRTDDLRSRDPAGFLDRITMLGMCLATSGLEGPETDEITRLTTDTSPIALAMAARLAAHLGCATDRDALGAARAERLAGDPAAYLRPLWDDAGVRAILVDDGYPLPAVDQPELARDSGLPVHCVARIEPWIAELREGASGFGELEEAFVARAREAAAAGAVAFKSVIAYRTGLDVASWERSECDAAFDRWRAAGWDEARDHAKPVRDTLFRHALTVAREAGIPLHVHCGGGDPDVVIAHARPSDLFPVLAEHLAQPVVLIHSGWPWVEEGAYVASVLPHVYLDTSIGTPWATLAIDSRLEILLGLAPPAKVLYGSDEASEPEVIWLSALVVREALERVLAAAVERRWMDAGQAGRIGAGVLAGNAARLHGIEVPA